MSQISVGEVTCSQTEMERGKREVVLTAKAALNKIEKLERERHISVNKMKTLIPQIKSLQAGLLIAVFAIDSFGSYMSLTGQEQAYEASGGA